MELALFIKYRFGISFLQILDKIITNAVKPRKGVVLMTVFEALSVMIAFAMLLIAILLFKTKG